MGVDSLQALPKFHSFFTKSSSAYSALPVSILCVCVLLGRPGDYFILVETSVN